MFYLLFLFICVGITQSYTQNLHRPTPVFEIHSLNAKADGIAALFTDYILQRLFLYGNTDNLYTIAGGNVCVWNIKYQ